MSDFPVPSLGWKVTAPPESGVRPVQEWAYSPSQISLWTECQRKYAFKYIAKLPSPSSAAAELGTAVHAQLEKYFLGGELDFSIPDRSGDIAAKGLKHLPDQDTPGLITEASFRFKSPKTGLWYQGRVDLTVPPRTLPRVGIPTVIDFKTTGNMRYAKTPEVLATDIQATLYAVDAIQKYNAPAVALKWVYIPTKTGASKPVTYEMSREAAKVNFEVIEEITKELDAVRIAGTDPNTLPPSLHTCDAYGGCPFKKNCNLTAVQRMKAAMTTTVTVPENSMIARLRMKNQGGSVPPAATPAIPPPPMKPVAPAFVPAAHHPADPNPPEKALPPPVEEVEEKAAVTVAEPATTRRRGRPVGSKNKPKETTADAAPIATDEELDTEDERDTITATPSRPSEPTVLEVKSQPSTKQEFALFVNCIPNASCPDASYFLAKAKARMEEADGLQDYRLVEYGKGAPLLLGRFREVLEADIPLAMTLDTSLPEAGIIKAYLADRATLVVTGVR